MRREKNVAPVLVESYAMLFEKPFQPQAADSSAGVGLRNGNPGQHTG